MRFAAAYLSGVFLFFLFSNSHFQLLVAGILFFFRQCRPTQFRGSIDQFSRFHAHSLCEQQNSREARLASVMLDVIEIASTSTQKLRKTVLGDVPFFAFLNQCCTKSRWGSFTHPIYILDSCLKNS